MNESSCNVTRLAGALGAEVDGISLQTFTDETIEAINYWLLKHQVLFFPDQHLGP